MESFEQCNIASVTQEEENHNEVSSGEYEEADSSAGKKTSSHRSKGKITKVKCGIPGCEAKLMLHQNLKEHTRLKHPGATPQIEGHSRQSSLDQFFSAGSRKRGSSDNSCRGPKEQKLDTEVDKAGSDVFKEDLPVEADGNHNVDTSEEKSEKKPLEMPNDGNNLLKLVSEKLERIVKKVMPNLDVSDCITEEELILKSLNCIESTVDVSTDIRTLKKAIDDLENASGIKVKLEKTKQCVEEHKTPNELINEARSIKEICEKVPEFESKPEIKEKEIECVVCHNTFSYHADLDQEFIDKPTTEKFRNTLGVPNSHWEDAERRS